MADALVATVAALISSLGGDLTPEQRVHASLCVKLAEIIDTAPGYAVAGVARELRSAVASLMGTPIVAQGVGLDDLDDLFGWRR